MQAVTCVAGHLTYLFFCSGVEGTEQCFPFAGVSPAQLQELDMALRGQLERLHEEISIPVEQLLANRGLPAKLNEVDAFLTAHPVGDERVQLAAAARQQEPPSSITRNKVADTKLETVHRLTSQLETLRWQLGQRRQELANRQEALRRRSEHLRDAQRLYKVALETGTLPSSTDQLETLVDRMIHQNHHQTVPVDQGDASTAS